MKNNPMVHRRTWSKTLATGSLLLAAALAGCSEGGGPSTSASSGTTSPTKTGPANAVSAGTASTNDVTDKPKAVNAASEVVIQAVTPDGFKKVIESQHGKVVLADFWATYCVPCRQKYPKTLALAKKYAGQGLAVVSMSMDSPDPDDQRKVREFLEEQHSQITNLANQLEDPDQAFEALGIDGSALPHYKVYGRGGKLRAKFGGDPDHGFDENDIEAAVVAALAEK